MSSVFSWQIYANLSPPLFCTPRPNLLTSYFCIPVPYDEKDMFYFILFYFFDVSSRRSCRSSQNCPASASSALVVGAQTQITLILNCLPYERTEIIQFFLRSHPSTPFWTLIYYVGYSISSKGFLPTVVDIMVI